MNKKNQTNSFGHRDTQPWYKNYMVLIFVIGLPLFVVVACIWFVFYSVQIKDTVVRDDWYMDGKTLYQDVSRDKLAHDLGLKGVMTFETNNNVEFKLFYPDQSLRSGKLSEGTPIYYPDELKLSISHATDINKDRDTVLTQQDKNIYSANVELDELASKYYVQVSSEDDLNWRLTSVGQLPQDRIEFKPLKSFDK